MHSVTVVIPTHNRPNLVGRAINSVLNQTVQADEIIVVDDANCHLTKEIVEGYGNDRLKYIQNPNKGASSSRNLGVEMATSDYVAFLDDDDVWLPKKIELQKNEILINNLDAVFSRILIEYENTNLSYATSAKLPPKPLEQICIENFIGGTISAVIRKELFLKVGGFDISFPAREEYDLWIRLLSNGAKIGIVEEALCVAYRSLSQRSRVSARILNYEKAIELLNKKHRDLINEVLSPQQQSIRISKQFEFLAAQGVSIGLRISPFFYYIKSFFNKPSLKPVLLAPLALLSPILLIKIRSKL